MKKKLLANLRNGLTETWVKIADMERRIRIEGKVVSNGVGIGTALILDQVSSNINKNTIDKSEVKKEILRMERAINETQIELYDLRDDFKDSLNERDNSIFEAYKMILKDKCFIQEIKDIISEYRYYASHAVDICISNYMEALLNSGNKYMKERVYDLKDIKLRIIRNMNGESKEEIKKIKKRQIVFVKQLTPSLAAVFGKKRVRGVVAEEGAAYLSHAAIILRGLNIPVINGVKYDEIVHYDKSQAIINADKGIVIINPSKEEFEEYLLAYKVRLKEYREVYKELMRKIRKIAITTDSYKIDITANVGSLEECEALPEASVDGIGLVRTELLFIRDKSMPGEDEQYKTYRKILNLVKNKPVVIRTLDIGYDKNLGDVDVKTNYSLENLRGIRYSLAQVEQFKKQLRAIVKASAYGDIMVTLPMVNNEDEIVKVRELLEEIYFEFSNERIQFKRLRVGAVIETREAVENIESITEKVDFINIGTNDMLEQFLEFNRKDIGDNRELDYLMPEFLGIVDKVIKKVKLHNRRISVCGEMASDPVIAILLVGMGADELSMSLSKINKVCASIRKVSTDEAKKMAKTAMECVNINVIRQVMTEYE